MSLSKSDLLVSINRLLAEYLTIFLVKIGRTHLNDTLAWFKENVNSLNIPGHPYPWWVRNACVEILPRIQLATISCLICMSNLMKSTLIIPLLTLYFVGSHICCCSTVYYFLSIPNPHLYVLISHLSPPLLRLLFKYTLSFSCQVKHLLKTKYKWP